MQDYILIGTVLKPHGIAGEIKIRSYAADPRSFAGWKRLFLKRDNAFEPLEVIFRRERDGFVYALPEGYSSMDDAEKLRGAELYIDRASLKPSSGILISDLIGCRAVDKNGRLIGTLADVLQYGPVDTWVFRTDSGTMMAPALLSVFTDADTASGIISVDQERLREVAVYENTYPDAIS